MQKNNLLKPSKKTPKSIKPVRGGRREGAGRPQGSGKYGEATKAIRVPQSLVPELQTFLTRYGQEKTPKPVPGFIVRAKSGKSSRLALYENKVAAGFPSPATDHIDSQLDLNEHLIKNPATTFYVRVEGNSMVNAGMYPNDLLMVDRSLDPTDGRIVIAVVNGEFTVKRLKITKNNVIQLVPENEDYPTLTINKEIEFSIWGVVTHVIHACL